MAGPSEAALHQHRRHRLHHRRLFKDRSQPQSVCQSRPIVSELALFLFGFRSLLNELTVEQG